jgi:predicted nucleic acid-binding protein
MLFVDASALVKRYVRERHSVNVRRSLTAAPIAISRLSDVPSALARLVGERRLPPPSRDRAITAFVTDIAAWHVVEITADVTALARTLLHRHDLRTGHAIQLASAVWLRQSVLLSGVLAFDTRLVSAARAEQLPTPTQLGCTRAVPRGGTSVTGKRAARGGMK